MTGGAPLLLLLLCAAPALPAPAPHDASDAMLEEHLWEQVRSLPPGQRPKVGLALSAGAVRGLAHIGVLQALQDAGFPIDVVAGTSMGAVVGAIYASGKSMEDLRTLPSRLTPQARSMITPMRLFRLFLVDSLISAQTFETFIAKELADKRFDQLGKPFACVAMDLRTGEKIVFREGPVAPAVRASANLPGIFRPVLYRHRYLVDGGVVDYIPIDAAKLLGAEWIIASVTEGDFSRSVPTSVVMTLSQIFDIRGAILSRQQRKEADIVIEPAVGDVAFYDAPRSEEVVKKGIVAASGRLPAAKEELILFTLPRLWQRWRGAKP
jgi:NTE family protein